MLQWLVKHSLRFRGIVLALACVVIAYGTYTAENAKLDVFPEFVQPQVEVQTEAPGLTAEEVEVLVTRPVESAIGGASEMETIRSESIQGLSVVTALFKENTDVYHARQMLAEKLASVAGELPSGIKEPRMFPLVSSTMDVLKFGLLSKKLTPMELRTFADWTLLPRLLAVPGVAKCSIFGGEVRQIQIQLHPERLLAFDLSVQEALDAARNATGVRGAGFIETPEQRINIQTDGQSLNPQMLAQVVVAHHEGRSVRLGDVASVVDGAAPKAGDALIMGESGILVTAGGQYGANTMEVTKGLERALDEMKPAFESEGIEYVPSLHRPARFIENGLRNVRSSLMAGGVLIAIVLVLFLLDLRTAFISFASIPLSLLAAVIVLDHFGATINTMTLAGFAVAIGVVVDDAIIDVENIMRRLRENRAAGNPQPVFAVILDASLEVRSAVVYATFIVALVFLPVLAMSGVQGRFFAPLATAFLLATMASLAVAVTVTPALCLLMFSRVKPHAEPGYLLRLKTWHRAALEKISLHPRVMASVIVLLVAGAIATLPFFGGEFLPEFREGHFVAQVVTAPGTSLPEMRRLGILISGELMRIPGIKSVEQQIGRAEMGEDTWGPNQSELHIELKPLSGREEAGVEDQIRAALAKFPGIGSSLTTFLGDRLGETLSGETAQVVINIFCDDLDVADRKARQIEALLQSIPGADDIELTAPSGTPVLDVKLRQERLVEFGYRPVEVLDAVDLAYAGETVGQLYDGYRVFDVELILDPALRSAPRDVGSLLVQNSEGLRMPLKELADIAPGMGRNLISHEGARRRQTVTCNTRGRDVASVVADIKRAVAAKVDLPRGAYIVYSGAAEQQAAAQRELILYSGVAAVGIVLLLGVVFRNARNLLLVLANVPFALVGGVLAAFVSGYFGGGGASMSLGTLVGFVTLFGITARNSIMMISHFEHLVSAEGMTWGMEAALRGAGERLAPILMTALVTALGLLPLALGSGEAGREIEGPMALVILGGLLTSTILNLLVLPTLALRYGKFVRTDQSG
ncbi:MAG TPA: efflux RND transporter permease subunit [Verrucomicrobiae bacterium]|jgi:CzcA family heavy metal efflux pump|nr:efflux RND transporter permease subunit [Verrucomicrobiae bacterium]